MASSDWEDLINEVPWQSATGATGPVLTTSPSRTSDTMSSQAQQTSVALHAALSRSVIKPLCLCTNQKNTRVGVGHETGYLVFRLVANEHITSSNADDDDDVELLEPSESCGKEQIASLLRERRLAQRATHHLVLDPLYNMTSEHFSTLYHSVHRKDEVTGTDSVAKDTATSHETQELDMLLSYTSTTLSQMRIFDEHSPISNTDSNSNSSPSARHKSAAQEEEEEEEEKRVGFSGGGVGVMALLYEQHCLAVVGGGPRPMSPHNVVLVLHNGAFLQSLTFSAPVVRLFLDARLLFVCTEHELRIYTNPMEREWTACGFQMSFTTTTTPVLTTTTTTTNNSVISDTQVVNESLTEGNSRDEASPVRRSTSASTDAARRSLSTATSSFAVTPVTSCSSQARHTLLLPCVMDYAHSCLLLRSAHSPCGFTLLQYSTSAALDSANGLSGQVKVRLCELGSCAAAHRNPLSSLALCLTASAALTSSTTTTLACARPSLVVRQTSLTRTVTHATVMVAACSAYATRITLWVLLEDNSNSTGRDAEARKSEAAMVTGTTTSSSCHAHFVLLREFRVGFRVSPATLLQRATHNVHEQDIHHLQFLQDGRFLFCVRNNRMLVFSVSDEAQDSATRDVCHEHPQAVQNKHSMLLAVNKVLPVQLSLDSYTRQDWASCEAALPMHDAVLYPRWLLLYKQDKAAAAIATARALAQGDTSEPGDREGTEYNNNSTSISAVGVIKGTQGWLGRMSRYVNQVYRAGVEQTGIASLHPTCKDDSISLNSTTTPSSGHTTCQTLRQCRTQAEEDEEGEHCERQGVHVTEALTQFAPCLLIWEQDKATTTSMKIDRLVPSETSVSSSPSTTVAKPVSGHPPRLYDKEGKILLHCVSCEGAYTTIRLYKDSGDIYCAPALPFTLQ